MRVDTLFFADETATVVEMSLERVSLHIGGVPGLEVSFRSLTENFQGVMGTRPIFLVAFPHGSRID